MRAPSTTWLGINQGIFNSTTVHITGQREDLHKEKTSLTPLWSYIILEVPGDLLDIFCHRKEKLKLIMDGL